MSVFLRPRNPIANLKQLDFPFTPQIDYSTDVKYDSYNTTHTNYQLYGYTRTENPQINLNCKFSAHTSQHFDLSLFAIKFLRTYSKMNYGRQDEQRGTPPRILRFFAYGEQMFNDVPVVIGKFNITFPDDIDYVKGIIGPDGRSIATQATRRTDVPTNTGPVESAQNAQEAAARAEQTTMYLPAFFQISISLLVQQNLYKAVNEFKLEDLALGKLGSKGYI
jgi:hypothetical protein